MKILLLLLAALVDVTANAQVISGTSISTTTNFVLQGKSTNFFAVNTNKLGAVTVLSQYGIGYDIQLQGSTILDIATANQITSDALVAAYDGVAAPPNYTMPKSWSEARSTAIDAYLTNLLARPTLAVANGQGVDRDAIVLDGPWPGFWALCSLSLDTTNGANIRYPNDITTNTVQGRYQFVSSIKTPKTLPTLASLQALDPRELASTYVGTNTSFNATVYLMGRTAVNDGGGGPLMYIAGTNYINDGGYVYNVTGGQFVRDFNQKADPRWWGVKFDGDITNKTGTDNTIAISNMVNSPYVLGGQNSAYGNHVPILWPGYAVTTAPFPAFTAGQPTNGGNYARGALILEGIGSSRSGIIFDGLSNGITTGNGRIVIKDILLTSTAARYAGYTVTPFQGNGIVITDPIDGVGVGFQVVNVEIEEQPSSGIFIEGGIEQGWFQSLLISRNRKLGVHFNGDTSYALAPNFAGYMMQFQTVRCINNGQPGWGGSYPIQHSFAQCESVNNCNPVYNGYGYKTHWFETAWTNSVGLLMDQWDIEDNRITTSIKFPTSTGYTFGSWTITNTLLNFLTAGVTTNRLAIISGSQPEQGVTSIDGIYEIVGVTANTLTVTNTVTFLSAFTPPATMPMTLQVSEANVGMFFSGGRNAKIRGGFIGSASAGVVLGGMRVGSIDQMRIANYSSSDGYLVNNGGGYSAGATTIAVDTGVGSIPVGIRVTFGSDTNVYTVATALSGGSFTIQAPGLINAVSNDVSVQVWNKASNITGIWDTQSAVLSFNNQIYTYNGIDTNGVFNQFYPQYVPTANYVLNNNVQRFANFGSSNSVTPPVVIYGGRNGSRLQEWRRDGFNSYQFGLTGANGFGFFDASDNKFVFVVQNSSGTQVTLGPANSDAPTDAIIRTSIPTVGGENIPGGDITFPMQSTGTNFPGLINLAFGEPTTNTLSTNSATSKVTFGFINGQLKTNNIPMNVSHWDGGTYSPLQQVAREYGSAMFSGTYLGNNDGILLDNFLGSAIKANTVGGGIRNVTASITLTDGQARWGWIRVVSERTFTGVAFFQQTQGSFTGDNENSIALYSYSGGTSTRIAITANDETIWKNTTGALVKVPFTGTIVLPPGFYRASTLFNASATVTAPIIGGLATLATTGQSTADYANSAKNAGSSSETALPASKTEAAISALQTQQWLGLY